MAGGQPAYIEDYQFTAKPLRWWRRFIWDFWPYWQASRPSFVLTVKRLGPPVKEQTTRWFVKFANGDETYGKWTIPPLQKDETFEFTVSNIFLGFTGDTLLILPRDLTSSRASLYETVYAFHTTPKIWLALAIIAAIFAGVFAGLGHWLLGLLA